MATEQRTDGNLCNPQEVAVRPLERIARKGGPLLRSAPPFSICKRIRK